MTLLITLDYLNECCALSINVDDKKYRSALIDAQTDMEYLLGTNFYNELVSQYEGNTLTADNDTLYENYVKNYLAWKTYSNYLPFANVDSTASGLRVQDDDNSSIVNELQLHTVEKNVQEKVNKYQDRMINYLKLSQSQDSTKYPLFTTGCKTVRSFSITSISKYKSHLININKTINNNE
jgi:hypothetical protein